MHLWVHMNFNGNWIDYGSFRTCFLLHSFGIRLLVLDMNSNLGDCSHILCKQFWWFPQGMFHPMYFIYLLFFVNNPSLLGEQRLWTYDYTDANRSGFVVRLYLQFILLLFKFLCILICNQIIDYFRYQDLLQVDAIWFKVLSIFDVSYFTYNNYPVLI